MKKKRQIANKILWVEYWIEQAHPSYKDYEIIAEKYDDKRWICKIELPLINETVQSISKTEVDAMLNAADKATKLIEEYMKEHSELKIQNEFKGKPYLIHSDRNGKYKSIGLSSEYRAKIGKKIIVEE